MSDKDAFVSAMLAPQSSNTHSMSKGLIQETGAVSSDATSAEDVSKTEEPTILELMMAAQADAQNIKNGKELKSNDSTVSNGFDTGFKKGFFGSSKNNKKKDVETSKIVESKPSGTNGTCNNNITTLKPSSNPATSSLVLNEVQEAMANTSEGTFLNQLKQGEWVTDDLMSSFSANPILAAGFKNSKCLAAMELMQKEGGPQEAKKRFAHDPEVNIFLKEFGYVMSNHFTNMDKSKKHTSTNTTTTTATTENSSTITKTTTATTTNPSPNQILISYSDSNSNSKDQRVMEIGPLHAQVLKQKEDIKESLGNDAVETERVNTILQDEELRDMLMDVELQQILQDCNDPIKFQQYMRNPVISRKVKKLYEAGLVGTTR